MRMPVDKETSVYLYPGYLPSKKTISQIVGEGPSQIQWNKRGQTEGISRKYLEKRMAVLADKGDWITFGRLLALTIYGIVLFPSAVEVVDLAAISVFWMVENHRVNPIPAILAETYMTLSFCHQQKGGKLKCCLQLLTIWINNHIYGRKYQKGTRHDTVHHPIRDYNWREGSTSLQTPMNRDEWTQLLSSLDGRTIWWKLSWWEKEEIIYCCGDFLNVPLMSPRGCINYNPAIAHRQFAYPQDVPSEEAVRLIHFRHNDSKIKDLSQRIRNAWNKVLCKGKPELGKRIITHNKEYEAWLKGRTSGVNLSFGPRNPLRGNNLQEINEHLAKQIEEKKIELMDLEEGKQKRLKDITRVQEEHAALQEEIARAKRCKAVKESIEVCRLRQENGKLKNEVEEVREQLKGSIEMMRSSKAKLAKVVKEKSILQNQIRGFRLLGELQQEIATLTAKLEDKMNELILAEGYYTMEIQGLKDELNQQAETAAIWKARHSDEVMEKQGWMEQCKKMILFANDVIPEFATVLRRAEHLNNPLSTPVEIDEFFKLCNDIIAAMKELMNF